MKNKDKYDLTKLQVVPKYMVNGCGRKITSRFTFDVVLQEEDHSEIVAKDVKAKENVYPYLMQWLESEESIH